MKPTIEQIGDLLALKRNERPEEGYWQDFLCEFHQNQREQAVKKSAVSQFFGNVTGHIFCLFALVVAGAEVAVGLSILVAFFRLKGTASVESRTWSREGDEM